MEGKERAEWRTKRAQEPVQEAVWESPVASMVPGRQEAFNQ